MKHEILGKWDFQCRQGSKFRGQVASAEMYRCGVDDDALLSLKYNAKDRASDSSSANDKLP